MEVPVDDELIVRSTPHQGIRIADVQRRVGNVDAPLNPIGQHPRVRAPLFLALRVGLPLGFRLLLHRRRVFSAVFGHLLIEW